MSKRSSCSLSTPCSPPEAMADDIYSYARAHEIEHLVDLSSFRGILGEDKIEGSVEATRFSRGQGAADSALT